MRCAGEPAGGHGERAQHGGDTITTPGALQSAFGLKNCKLTGPCNDYAQFPRAIEHTQMITVELDNWRVMGITIDFRSDFFAEFDQAARAKFGAPTRELAPVMQNGFGAQFVNNQAEWKDAAGNTVTIARYINATDGMLILKTAEQIAKEDAYWAAQKPKL